LAIVASNARKIDATSIEACFRSSFSDDESTFQTLLHKLTDAIKGALSHGGPSMERDSNRLPAVPPAISRPNGIGKLRAAGG
jgi:hypothetical protein